MNIYKVTNVQNYRSPSLESTLVADDMKGCPKLSSLKGDTSRSFICGFLWYQVLMAVFILMVNPFLDALLYQVID